MVKEIGMIKGARVLVDTCANVQPGEQVAIVTDYNKVKIAEAVTTAVLERGAEPVLMIMAPRTTHGEDPPASIAEALTKVDVVFAPTTYSLTRSNALVKACAAGARFISMPDYIEDMMIKGGLFEDFFAQRKVAEKVGELFTAAKRARVTAPAGTDVTMELGERKGNVASGICHEPGTYSSPPNIETNVSPIEGTAEGIIVVDGSIPIPEIGKVMQPVRLTLKEGKIVAIEGGVEATTLDEVLAALNDPPGYLLGELGIGMNRQAKIIGTMLEDEGAYGTVHFGFGNNHTTGGEIISKMHLDVIVKKATVELDGKVIMRDGELLI